MLRQQLNAKRLAVTAAERHTAALQATKLFTQHKLFMEAKHIACYLPRQEEFDAIPIIQAIWQANKKCYLPVLSKQKEHCMEFAPYQSDSDLQPNRYRILEPVTDERIVAEKLDVVILPLVGFDLHGNRLGVGGGYYDRTFAFLLGKTRVKPTLIGLGYEFQCVSELPCESWDVPLDGMITEKVFHLSHPIC